MTEPQHPPESPDAAERAKDPVCGMMVKRESPRGGTFDYKGTRYFFCNDKCRTRFSAEPAKYLEPPAAEPTPRHHAPVPRGTAGEVPQSYICPMDPEVREPKPGPCPKCGMVLELELPQALTRVEWVCPMHPEIVRREAGTCPICGMALEPRTSAVEVENPELKDMSRRFWVALALCVPLLGWPWQTCCRDTQLHGCCPRAYLRSLSSCWRRPFACGLGWPFLVRAVQSVRNRHLNMFTLIGLGVSVAYLFSLVAAVFPGLFPRSFRNQHGEVGLYFEAAAAIVTLILLGLHFRISLQKSHATLVIFECG